jgi:hypothetical protein
MSIGFKRYLFWEKAGKFLDQTRSKSRKGRGKVRKREGKLL